MTISEVPPSPPPPGSSSGAITTGVRTVVREGEGAGLVAPDVAEGAAVGVPVGVSADGLPVGGADTLGVGVGDGVGDAVPGDGEGDRVVPGTVNWWTTKWGKLAVQFRQTPTRCAPAAAAAGTVKLVGPLPEPVATSVPRFTGVTKSQ
jgi:hypothetical protein